MYDQHTKVSSFLYTINKLAEKEVRKTIPVIIDKTSPKHKLKPKTSTTSTMKIIQH
jgi:hypothetical protein